ncbi:hypothetical protein PV10_03199 [Exophiala mesophila]|uniref:Major facilitator superfamily (MFS) profile domain-containing protein n=1 Tax=Exophiala mesophila TaxID=212818 RepID=A0A0D1ZLT9_EXOME|nr:uncharacterized protein PV10_03199 [Exophiala mesophila]KIV95562.1 hypothetical protein PV10_03199 [Exophiala mesophila]
MDETVPLLRDESLEHPPDSRKDSNAVDFDSRGDLDNPREWPNAYKWSIVTLLAFTSFTVTFTCISVVPIATRIVADLSDGDSGNQKTASVLLVTIWELGEAAGPLLIAPFSEIFGRYAVINVCNVLFTSATILAALCQNATLFIFARVLTGVAVASNVLNPAIIGDLFVAEQRGTAMSLIVLAPIMGGAIGPAIAGAIAETLGWRSVMWMSVALSGLAEVLFLTFFRETYPVTILARRTARLRKETGNLDLHSVLDTQEGSEVAKFWNAIARPVLVLFNSGVLQVLSLFSSLLFTYFYTINTCLPDILQERYGLTPAQTGSIFVFFSVGSAPSILLLNRALDRVYIWLRTRHKGVGQPEYRLPFTIVGGFAIPFVVLAYGWASEEELPLPFLVLTIALLGSVMMLGMLPVFAYVVDAFHLYSASAMTAIIVTRCLMGTFLPLATQPLVDRFGYGWAFTIFAAMSMAVAPIPLLVYRYGAAWRQRSVYTRDHEE